MGRSAQVKAGVVVLVGLAILAVGVFLVSGGGEVFRDKKEYTVYFKNAGNIGTGDAVYLAGRRVGEVSAVETWSEQVEGQTRYLGVVVSIEIHESAKIQVDSTFTITQSITRIVTMNIEYGQGRNVEPGEARLTGTTHATFEQTIDQAAALITDAGEVVATARRASERLDRMLADLEDRALPEEVQRFVATLNRAADDAAGLAGELRPQVRQALDRAVRAAEEYERLGSELRDGVGELLRGARDVMDRVAGATDEVQAVVRENRASFKAFAQGLEDAARRLPAALERLETFVRSSERTMTEVRPELVRTVEHAKRAMENFSSLTEDLRTAPWKLVNKPSDAEVREIHLYNAARLYVSAASRVRESIDELEALRASGALEGQDRAEAVDEAIARLQRTLAEYDAREKALVDRMVGTR